MSSSFREAKELVRSGKHGFWQSGPRPAWPGRPRGSRFLRAVVNADAAILRGAAGGEQVFVYSALMQSRRLTPEEIDGRRRSLAMAPHVPANEVRRILDDQRLLLLERRELEHLRAELERSFACVRSVLTRLHRLLSAERSGGDHDSSPVAAERRPCEWGSARRACRRRAGNGGHTRTPEAPGRLRRMLSIASSLQWVSGARLSGSYGPGTSFQTRHSVLEVDLARGVRPPAATNARMRFCAGSLRSSDPKGRVFLA